MGWRKELWRRLRGMNKTPGNSLEIKLQRFLFSYRTLPHSTTGHSPAELLMGRRLRTALDLLKPSMNAKMKRKQHAVSEKCEKHVTRILPDNTKVFVKNFAPGPKWLPGIIIKSTGPVSYVVVLNDGREVRRHVDHIRERREKSTDVIDVQMNVPSNMPLTPSQSPSPVAVLPNTSPRPLPSPPSNLTNQTEVQAYDTAVESIPEELLVPSMNEPSKSTVLRRSSRISGKPDYFGNNVCG